ncbi:MAG: response regulator [Chloroflexota bacterium]
MRQLSGKHILIVEDNPLNRIVYQMSLGLQGAVLVFERHGRDALRRVKHSTKWDLIILDLMLGSGISGFDIYKSIRELPDYADIPIIAISAADAAPAMAKAKQLGFSGFISKPIDEAQIVQQVNMIINGETVWDMGGT